MNLLGRKRTWLFEALALALAAGALAQDLTELSLEDLMQVEVTSASRKPQPLGETASAVYILTASEIARSGATSLPELLRRVPGLHVARLESSGWAVTARGFNHRFASKMLVQIDGRTVYTPLFGGVYWDAQDLPLEIVERVEIIRGPGATMWGENAVNGVINVITKTAAETRGGRVETAGGDEDVVLQARFGGGGERFDYRVYGRAIREDAVALEDGSSARDVFRGVSAGMRLDLDLRRSRSISVDGQIYASEAWQRAGHATFDAPYSTYDEGNRRVSGGHVGGWARPFTSVEATFLGYVDRSRRESPDGFLEIRDTFELDYQQRHRSESGRHDLVWGGQVRYTRDDFENTFRVSLDPAGRSLHLLSGFLQDEVDLASGRLRVTVGAKLTHNTYTGLEVQPSLRALVKLDRSQAIWTAFSRAVRTPTRIENDMRVNAAVMSQPEGLPALVSLFGSRRIEPERVLAYEAGYRVQWRKASLDLAAFTNRYDGLVTTELGAPALEEELGPPHVLVPIHLVNGGPARTSGLEALARARVLSGMELQGWYTWFRMGEGFQEGAPEEGALIPDGGVAAVPAHQGRLDARIDLPARLALDAGLHYVGAIDAQSIPSYLRLDLRLSLQATEALEIAIAGRNLLDERHAEFAGEQSAAPFQIERSLLARVVWKF